MQVSPLILGSSEILSGVSDRTAIATANILPCLLCGEESAVRVFLNEGNRIGTSLYDGAQDTLFRIAAEEEYHEQLLCRLNAQLPEARDFSKRRQLSRRYFAALSSRDCAEHFARIAAIDSAVCIILSEMCRPGGPFPRDSATAAIFTRIRRDEGRHVAFSNHYATRLGVTTECFAASFRLVRSGLVDLLRWCGDGFDLLTVDPDRLFKRLLRPPPKLLRARKVA